MRVHSALIWYDKPMQTVNLLRAVLARLRSILFFLLFCKFIRKERFIEANGR